MYELNTAEIEAVYGLVHRQVSELIEQPASNEHEQRVNLLLEVALKLYQWKANRKRGHEETL